jgi:hypothetical protein
VLKLRRDAVSDLQRGELDNDSAEEPSTGRRKPTTELFFRSLIDGYGRKHQNQTDPKAPVVVRALPIRNVAMMALAHRVRVFSVVQGDLQSRGQNRHAMTAQETVVGIRRTPTTLSI